MVDLCEPRDLWDHGLPRGAVANPGRPVALIDPLTDTLTLGEHCFDDGLSVRLRAANGGTLPGGITAGVSYFVKVVDDARFQLEASVGAGPVDILTAGMSVLVVAPVNYKAACEWASALVYDMVPAHAVPFTLPVPPILRATAAELAARKIMSVTGSGEPASLMSLYDLALKRVERWATGVPIRDPNSTEASNLAASAVSPTAPLTDRRGWSRYGCL